MVTLSLVYALTRCCFETLCAVPPQSLIRRLILFVCLLIFVPKAAVSPQRQKIFDTNSVFLQAEFIERRNKLREVNHWVKQNIYILFGSHVKD